ncbi:stage V sporulation protein B [Clostridia bacterium]|nr:stage V sporulation protein B [Clostridia bacterium]
MAKSHNTTAASGDYSIIKHAAVLGLAAFLARVIGFLYRLPLTNMIGDEGQGIYASGYQVYNFLLILSSAGLPVAISKMVSERIALNQYANAHNVFKVAMSSAVVLGAFFSIILYVFATEIAVAVDNPDSALTLVTLAPTILLVAVMSVYRGYFQGMGNSVPTGASQLFEQIVNAVFSIVLAGWLMSLHSGSIAWGAAGGTAGTGVGALFGFFFLILVYRWSKPKIQKRINDQKRRKEIIVYEGKQKILKSLMMTAFPIIAGTAVFSFTNLVDMKMVIGRLTETGFSTQQALSLYGQLSNKYVAITTLPIAIAATMAVACVPSLSAANVTHKNRSEMSASINMSLRYTMMLSIPAAIGIGVLSDQILLLLFKNYPEGGMLLKAGALSIIFLSIVQVTTGMLQSLNKFYVPIVAALVGVALKIPISYVLLGIPEINVIGAIIGTTVCYVAATFIDLSQLKKTARIKLDVLGFFVKPMCASLFMGLVCYFTYYSLYYYVPSNTIAVIFSIVTGMLSYMTAMIFIGGFRLSDLEALPKSHIILGIFRKLGVYQYLLK